MRQWKKYHEDVYAEVFLSRFIGKEEILHE